MFFDGNVEVVGRADNQVKIRGMRIELGEIENILLQHSSIRETIVMAKEDEDTKYLCAYIVSNDKLEVNELRQFLLKYLPENMVPSYFVQVDKMPLTTSGKIDRKKLITLESFMDLETEYVAPKNEMEEKLVHMWASILKRENIGVEDNFFELGGHSLKAARFMGEMHKEFNVEMPLVEFFKSPCIRKTAEYIEKADKNIYVAIKKVGEKDYYEASSAQKRMYLLQQFDLKSTGYNMPRVMVVEGNLNVERVEKSFAQLIRRHETLRTCFEAIEDQIVQRVNESVNFKIEHFQVKCIKDLDKDVDNIVKDFVRIFDLNKAPLLRVGVIKLEEHKHILMFDMHHIISDGVSMSILIKEFTTLYNGQNLEPLKLQYKDYSEWQNNFLKSEGLKKQKQYWINRFSDEIPVLNMPTDFKRPLMQSFEGDSISFKLDKELTKVLNIISKETQSTMYMVLLSGINILLSKYSGQEDIIVGSPIEGRSHADLQKLIGVFVNTLAMRNYPDGNMTYEKFLKEVKENALEAYSNQVYQFDELVDKLSIARDISRNPLFDVMFTMQNFDSDYVELKELIFKGYNQENKIAKFDLEFSASEMEENIMIYVQYSTKLYKRKTIERMIEHFINILKAVTADIKIKLNEIDILDDVEKGKILYKFNNTKVDYPNDKTIQELFEDQVKKTPHNIALEYNNEKVTYSELNNNSNKIGRFLNKNNINNKPLVGIMLERSPLMVECILGIWKAGGAYIPIDVNAPIERITCILKDSGIGILITKSEYVDEKLEKDFEGIIIKMDLHKCDINKEEERNLDLNIDPSNLAYIIYTSGSTGNPKGAMVEHMGMTNHMYAKINELKITEESVIVQNASQCFDISVWQFFAAVICGGKTVIYSNEIVNNPEEMIQRIVKDEVSILEVVPSFLDILLDYLEENKVVLANLEYVVVTGEELKINLIKRWFELYKNIKMVNAYGPTEASDDITHYIMNKCPEAKNIPVGYPIQNLNIYIIDKNMKLCPIGVKGEIVVSGVGVGRGYLNDVEKTRKVFMEDPFRKEEKIRLYKTGDLGRWLPDGNIEFFGRIDNQVKIRGFRIELGEIENKLLSIPNIKESVVTVKENKKKGKYICAYVVSEKEIKELHLRDRLREMLPEYMIPSYFVQLEKMPLTPNGKVNRNALPKLEDNIINTGIEYEAPRNEVEEKLCLVWKEVLGVERISINDNFFELGGDSIKAIQIVSRLKRYGYTLEMREIFKNPRIRELSRYVENLCISFSQTIVEGNTVLTPIQTWFFERNFVDKHHFNQSVMLYRKERFDEKIVMAVFEKILLHHDALRMVYETSDNNVIQFNRSNHGKTYELEVVDFRNKEDYEEEIIKVCNRIQESIDLSKGPLVKIGLFKTDEGDHMLIAIHHLVVDGVSWRIIFEDFNMGYNQHINGEEILFQDKTTSYKEWAQKLKEYSSSRSALKELDYWNKLESNRINPLPKDYECSIITKENMKTLGIALSKEETEDLLKNVNMMYNTEINDILLTALGLTIKDWMKQEKILIYLEGHGREQIIKGIDISRTVGWFTSEYPVILDMKKPQDIAYSVKSVKENLRHIPNKGIGYGILRYLTDKNKLNGMDFKLKPEIGFDYLGQFDQDMPVGLFEMSRIYTGNQSGLRNDSLYSLSFTAIVADSKLLISLEYNSGEYSEQTIQNILEKYRNNLCAIIKHCISNE